jgi:hypothetical protein
MKGKGAERWVDLSLLALLPLASAAVVAAEHFGVFDRWTGLTAAEQVSARFDESYAPDASRPVFRGDPAWKPMMRLIRTYSKAKLQADKQPGEIARFQASLSTNSQGYEWTAPSTPIVVLYGYWPPGAGRAPPRDDITIVGTIGQLHEWIDRSRNQFHFLVNDLLLALMPVGFGLWLWRINYGSGDGE